MNQVSEALTIDNETSEPRKEIVPVAAVEMTPMAMVQYVIQSGQPIEVVREMVALAKEIKREQAREAFDAAMAAAKAEIPTITKNRLVDFTGKTGIRTHYRHEDLGEIARTIDPILAKHGLSYRFRTHSPIGEPVTVTCIVSHREGHSEENTLVGPRDDSGNKNPIQSIGSTITFLQRYTLKPALGLAASNDDDGKASSQTVDDGPITEEQATTIRALIEETETDIAKFCELMKVESIPELPASQFARVIASLEAKKRKMAS